MEIKYKQKGATGCGLFAVANVWNLSGFARPNRLVDRTQAGCTIHQLNFFLNEDGYDFHISELYFNILGNKLPADILDLGPQGTNENRDAHYYPVLFIVKYGEKSLEHMVSGLINNARQVYIFDSLQSKVKRVHMSQLNDMYYKINGMFGFSKNSDNDFCFIDKEQAIEYFTSLSDGKEEQN